MGEATGFLKWAAGAAVAAAGAGAAARLEGGLRGLPGRRKLQTQAGRCMDCGIPFCNNGCPLGNLIPDWNDLVYRDHWRDAIDRLHATNNFPEFTGRLCPAPCEAACVLGINADPVTIKQVEVEIIDRAWDEGWVTPQIPSVQDRQAGRRHRLRPGRARRRPAADPRRPRRDRARAGRPHRRPAALRHPRVQDGEAPPRPAAARRWRPRAPSSAPTPAVGDDIDIDILLASNDAIVLACGATAWRDLPVPGRELDGIHQAMEYLPWANRVQEGDIDEPPITAAGKHVDHHRRRRHRRRLPRHVAPPGRGVGHAARDPAPPAGRPGRRQPVAAVEPRSTARRRPTRRAASGCSA